MNKGRVLKQGEDLSTFPKVFNSNQKMFVPTAAGMALHRQSAVNPAVNPKKCLKREVRRAAPGVFLIRILPPASPSGCL